MLRSKIAQKLSEMRSTSPITTPITMPIASLYGQMGSRLQIANLKLAFGFISSASFADLLTCLLQPRQTFKLFSGIIKVWFHFDMQHMQVINFPVFNFEVLPSLTKSYKVFKVFNYPSLLGPLISKSSIFRSRISKKRNAPVSWPFSG